MKNARRKTKDAQLAEFERKDLGKDLKSTGQGALIKPAVRQKLTSIFLDPSLVAILRQKAERRGMRYQTLLKMIVYEHLGEY